MCADVPSARSSVNFAPTPVGEATKIADTYAVLGGCPIRSADVSVVFLHAVEAERVIAIPLDE